MDRPWDLRNGQELSSRATEKHEKWESADGEGKGLGKEKSRTGGRGRPDDGEAGLPTTRKDGREGRS